MMPCEHYVAEFHSSTLHFATALSVCKHTVLQAIIIMAIQKIRVRQQSMHKDGSPGNNGSLRRATQKGFFLLDVDKISSLKWRSRESAASNTYHNATR